VSYRIKDILKTEVVPALGCTEPVAIALGAAAAASLIPGDDIESIEIAVDPNIFKNGMAVAIPGTPGLTGLDTAAAIGAVGGDPLLKLEVLESVTDAAVDKARKMLNEGKIKVDLLHGKKGIYVHTTIKSKENTAECVIQELHDNIVSLALNNEPVEDHPMLSGGSRKTAYFIDARFPAWSNRRWHRRRLSID
jgi:L-cysteine desulfidase